MQQGIRRKFHWGTIICMVETLKKVEWRNRDVTAKSKLSEADIWKKIRTLSTNQSFS